MQSDFNKQIKSIEKCFGVKIEEPEIFQKALTHTSFTRENEINVNESYERLEFLGDAVLKLCISDILFKKFPAYNEGDMTKIRSIIVSDNMLAQLGKQMDLNELLKLGKQEEKSGGRNKKSIIACAFEAILGAYYLQNSYEKIFPFLEKIFVPEIEKINSHSDLINAKATLQEYTQSLNKKLPHYTIVEEKGPEHNKIFVVEVSYMNKVLAQGKGKTKRDAEQECAMKACKDLGIIK